MPFDRKGSAFERPVFSADDPRWLWNVPTLQNPQNWVGAVSYRGENTRMVLPRLSAFYYQTDVFGFRAGGRFYFDTVDRDSNDRLTYFVAETSYDMRVRNDEGDGYVIFQVDSVEFQRDSEGNATGIVVDAFNIFVYPDSADVAIKHGDEVRTTALDLSPGAFIRGFQFWTESITSVVDASVFIAGDDTEGRKTATIRMRYDPRITGDSIIRWDGSHYRVDTISYPDRRRTQVVSMVEVSTAVVGDRP